MKLAFVGMSHLGQTYKKACEIRGFETVNWKEADLVFVTEDVTNHKDMTLVTHHLNDVIELPELIPIIVCSQIPPGFLRPYMKRLNLFYQVDTLIVNHALERAVFPERIIIGCKYRNEVLPVSYLAYLNVFNCPIFKMSLESAELIKLAINYFLAKQIETANEINKIAKKLNADYEEMIPAIRADARIGQTAYIKPGVVGGNLVRDVITIKELLND